MFLTHLECTSCGLRHEWLQLQNLCTACQKPLFAIVDLAAAGRVLTREKLATREKSLWRYREVLPLPGDVEPVSLGEGGTPLLRAARFGGEIDLWVKDESQNPTQSFKARGMAVAVSMAKHLGATKLAVPSAGNAGGALAAYAARAGLEAHIFMPRDTPRANIIECRELGAQVTLIDGLITDCGAEIARRKDAEGWFDMSTLKEPYRVEGRKEACLLRIGRATRLESCPTSSFIHWRRHRACRHVESIRRIRKPRLDWFRRDRACSPLQASVCASIVPFSEAGRRPRPRPRCSPALPVLRVPKAIGDFLMLKILRIEGRREIGG